ncbi:MAG: hypothetical protein HW391_109 [Chloroflexi bacterium]|nr:hypothetical protein [Chloroflexota bacterium]
MSLPRAGRGPLVRGPGDRRTIESPRHPADPSSETGDLRPSRGLSVAIQRARARDGRARELIAAALGATLLLLAFGLPALGAPIGPTKLLLPEVSPRAADSATSIAFTVTYRNAHALPPEYVRVSVAGRTLPMTGNGTDWKAGVTFTVWASLPPGAHAVRFEARDAERFADALDAGTVVIAAAPTPTPSPPAPPPTPTPTPSPTQPPPAPTPTPSPTAPPPDPTARPPAPDPDPTAAPTSSSSPNPAAPASTSVPAATPASDGAASGVPGTTGATTGGTAPGGTGPGNSHTTGGPGGTDDPGGWGIGIGGGSGSDGGTGSGAGPAAGYPFGTGESPAAGEAAGEAEGPGASAADGGAGAAGAGGGAGWFSAVANSNLVALGLAEPGRLDGVTTVFGSLAVTTWMAFTIFNKRRRDGEPPAADAVLHAAAATGVGIGVGHALASVAVVPEDPEAFMPRWRRPSLIEARKVDPVRTAVPDRPRLAFGFATGGPGSAERRLVRYAVAQLLDRPDEFRGTRIGELTAQDEVEVKERSGAYCFVVCPDGREGWVHRTTLGDIVDMVATGRAGYGAADDSMDGENALAALLTARGMR